MPMQEIYGTTALGYLEEKDGTGNDVSPPSGGIYNFRIDPNNPDG